LKYQIYLSRLNKIKIKTFALCNFLITDFSKTSVNSTYILEQCYIHRTMLLLVLKISQYLFSFCCVTIAHIDAWKLTWYCWKIAELNHNNPLPHLYYAGLMLTLCCELNHNNPLPHLNYAGLMLTLCCVWNHNNPLTHLYYAGLMLTLCCELNHNNPLTHLYYAGLMLTLCCVLNHNNPLPHLYYAGLMLTLCCILCRPNVDIML
jgi:hypothetical protein